MHSQPLLRTKKIVVCCSYIRKAGTVDETSSGRSLNVSRLLIGKKSFQPSESMEKAWYRLYGTIIASSSIQTNLIEFRKGASIEGLLIMICDIEMRSVIQNGSQFVL